MHLCSKELHRDYSIPCQNIEPYNLCSGDNLTVVINNKIRAICLYRACRTHWIPKILNLEKLNDSRVKLYLNEKENKLYETKKGFATLEKMLPDWIEETLEEIENK